MHMVVETTYVNVTKYMHDSLIEWMMINVWECVIARYDSAKSLELYI